ncbi:MAG: hypothetical protein COU29_01050 [Candidatus Magasanikbacteria bacterium CG10_big_fil_rev_8_21_14_0_10_36_32]|uniref:Uncharacterized protein n=1 Tax=Candidatus Magasanikbacteria bacterium CG10_big_fil_rev_8_21_14_0_10_36_32 TaxID=1974646 RepID=A0A2M6W6D8_9BACT|nr:MAG: hypothetical protein COU29_01050 [Candidatus Magasanikbacteria bacterium CG10_big_fil_rev_8_21_14_0_10_36_32]
MNGISCGKFVKTELKADLVISLVMAFGICLLTSLIINIFDITPYSLFGIAVVGLILGTTLGLMVSRWHGLVAGLIVGLGTCLSVGAGILLGKAISALFSTYTALWIIIILLLICKYLFIKEICIKN